MAKGCTYTIPETGKSFSEDDFKVFLLDGGLDDFIHKQGVSFKNFEDEELPFGKVEKKKSRKREYKPRKTEGLTFNGIKRSNAKEIYKEARNIDTPVDARGIALQYLSGGGTVNASDAAAEVTGRRISKTSREEVGTDMSEKDFATDNGPTVKQIAHSLWEDQPEETQHQITDQDIRNALIDAISEHDTRLEAANTFIDEFSIEKRLSEQEQRYYESQVTNEEKALNDWLAAESERNYESEEFLPDDETINHVIDNYEQGNKEQAEQPATSEERASSQTIGENRSAEQDQIEKAAERIKEAQSAYDKASTDLRRAEKRISEKQATQGSLLPTEGTQEELFGVGRDEAKEILDPLRQRVKETKAALDQLLSQTPEESPGQQTLFEKTPEALRNAANALRGLKFNKKPGDTLQSNIFGIPIAIYDGALETIATLLDKGADLAKAIQAGIDYIRANGGAGLDEPKFRQYVDDVVNGRPTRVQVQAQEDLSGLPQKERVRGAYRHLMESNIDQGLKDNMRIAGISPKGTRIAYKVADSAEAQKAGKAMVKAFGVDQALQLARLGTFHPSVNSAVFAEAIDHFYTMEQRAANPQDRFNAAKRWADTYDEYAELLTGAGQFGAYAYQFYKTSPLGFILTAKNRIDERRAKFLARDEKSLREAYEALRDVPEFRELFAKEVQEAVGKSKNQIKKENRQKISDAFDKLKLNKNNTYAVFVPPPIINGAIEIMKQATLLGYEVADVIAEGIKYINARHKEGWDQDKFTNDFTPIIEQLINENKETHNTRLEAYKKQLKKQISDIDEEIATGVRKARTTEKLDLDEEAKTLVAERDAKKAERDRLIPNQDARSRAAITRLENEIKDLESQIANKERKAKETTPREKSEREKELIEKRNQLREQLNKIVPPEKTAEQILRKWEKKLGKLKPDQRKDLLRKAIADITSGKGLDFENFKEMYAQALGLPTLTPEMQAKLQDLGDRLNGVDKAREALEKDPSQINIDNFIRSMHDGEKASREVNDLLGEKDITLDRILNIARLNTLGVLNLLVNPLYNTWFMPIRFTENLIKTGLDYGLKYIGINRPDGMYDNVFFKQRGYFLGFGKGAKRSVINLYTGDAQFDYFQKSTRQNIQPIESAKELIGHLQGTGKKLTGSEVVNAMVEMFPTMGASAALISRFLQIGDLPFRFAAERAAAENIAQQKGLRDDPKAGLFSKTAFILNPDEASKEKIRLAGERAVFAQDNFITKGLNVISHFLSNASKDSPLGKVGYGIGKIVGATTQPFLKIPLNNAMTIVELAVPELAILRGAFYAAPTRYQSRDQALEAFSRGIVGYSISMALTMIARAGLVSGTDDDPNKINASIYKEDYVGDRTLNISGLKRWLRGGDPSYQDDDTTIKLNWLGIPGTIMQMRAQQYDKLSPEQWDKEGYFADLWERFHGSFVNGLKDNVFGNTSALMDALNTGNAYKINRWLRGSFGVGLNSFDPAWLANASKISDHYKVDYSAMNTWGQLKAVVQERFWNSDNLPKQITVWGKKRTDTPKGTDPLLYQYFDISQHRNIDTDDFGYNILALYSQTRDDSAIPSRPQKAIRYNKQMVQLSPLEYEDFQIMVGTQRSELVQALMQTSEYASANADEKIKLLVKKYQEGYQLGKDEFVMKHSALFPPIPDRE